MSLPADWRPEEPPPSYERWRTLAEATLKGASFEKRLVGRTGDGIPIPPLATRDSAAAALAASGAVGASPWTRGALRDPQAPWVVAQRIDLADPAAANRQILADLEGGASGLVLVIAGSGMPGIRIENAGDVEQLLAGVYPELIAITLEAGTAAFPVARLFADWFATRNLHLGTARFCPGFDPLAVLASTGSVAAPAALGRALADAVADLRQRGFRGPLLLADARPWHEAGATDAQTLAHVLASAVAMLRLLDGNGVPPAEAVPLLAFKLPLDPDQFGAIAALRALRLLWARATEAMGIAPQRAVIHAESARRALTRRDPWVNLLRTTVACFAAAVGGADEIALHPFTSAEGVPDGFARRLARNTQAIVLEEAGIGRIADPAGGSFHVEALTEALAAEAWRLFQEVERQGGLLAALHAGTPQEAIAAAAAKRADAVAHRRAPITGVSEFPDVGETPVPVLARKGVDGQRAPDAKGLSVAPLPSLRWAEPFERLRDAADRAAARDGKRPAVFLAALGRPSETIARATLAKNLLEAGGLSASGNDGFPTIEALAEAFRASGADAACLCSTDEVYAASGAEAAAALRAAGAGLVLLAGRPVEGVGADLHLFAGMDAVAALQDLHRRLGIG